MLKVKPKQATSMFSCSPVEAPATPARDCLCQSPAFARLNALMATRFSRRGFMGAAAAGAAALAFAPKGSAARVPAAPAAPTAFTNLRLFDGASDALRSGLRVVVEGQRIRAVEAESQPLPPGVQVVNCGGRTLMPGLIDAHYHVMMASVGLNVAFNADAGYLNLLAAGEAERVLMRGFTSIRDLAGPAFGLKRAIDTGLVPGPRIWPCGAMISQTSGHGDYRSLVELPSSRTSPLSRGDQMGGGAIADGVTEVLRRAREQLMLGATQLKLAAGGGVGSNHDPLDVSQYTEAEFRAAVDAAENWGTYVTVHAYTPRAIQTAIRGGVRCIDHGQLIDERTAEIMAEKGIWLSIQPFLDDEDAITYPEGSANQAKQRQMVRGTDTAYGFAKKHGLKTAWGTDALFDARLAGRQGAQLTKMTRWYTPAEALRMATGVNAELLAMSGPRNPYAAPVGVVAAGAMADLLLLDGDPLANIRLIEDPERNLRVIMKDGRIFKNTLA
jgi:imidazolonepropionase-like amidohydrolase